MKWEGCSIQAGKSEDKNCVGYSWSHEFFFLVSVINRFFSYKSCLEIQTAILAFNKFIPVLKCFFGTTGVKNYLLMKMRLISTLPAVKDLGYVHIQSCICATCPKYTQILQRAAGVSSPAECL